MNDVALDVRAMGRHGVLVLAVGADEAEADRDMDRIGPRAGGALVERLAQGEGQPVGAGVVVLAHRQGRGAGLVVPDGQMREVNARGRLEAGEIVLDRRGVAVMALEIEVHPLPEAILAEDGGEHPDDLGALVVDGGRVEVVDLLVFRRSDGMLERALILGELVRLQAPDRADALHRGGALVGAEFLVAIDRQAFLQAELEPVAAGDAVAGPVVEIFVGDHRLDAGIVGVGRRLRIEQHVFVVEDVEALVLHRAHVEVGDGDDVEHVEVVFAAEAALVPDHRALQRVHGVAGLPGAALLGVDGEFDRLAAGGGEGFADGIEIAGDEREEIGRLVERVVPDGVMAAVAEITALGRVAVRQEDRGGGTVGLDADPVGRQHVGAVEEIGDAAEALGLALGAPDAVGAVEPHQLGVLFRHDAGRDVEKEAVAGRGLADRQPVGRRRIGIGLEHGAIEGKAGQGQLVAVEHQRRILGHALAALQHQPRVDLGPAFEQADRHVHAMQDEIGRAIIFQPDRLAVFTAQHGLPFPDFPGS